MSAIQQQENVPAYPSSRDSVRTRLSSLKDGDLVEKALTGNQAAFETLVEHYHVPLHRFIDRYFGD